MRIILGMKVRDRISGLTGIAVGRTEYLTGCTRVIVQPQEIKDGQVVSSTYVDEPMLEIVDARPVEPVEVGDPGGPKAEPTDPRR